MNEIIEIKEDTVIGDIVLEAGDKIEVLKEALIDTFVGVVDEAISTFADRSGAHIEVTERDNRLDALVVQFNKNGFRVSIKQIY